MAQDDSHRAAAERAIPLVSMAGDALERAMGVPGLHPAVVAMLRPLAAQADLWARLLPYMTGPGPETPKTTKKGRTK